MEIPEKAPLSTTASNIVQTMKSIAIQTPKEEPKYDGTYDGTTWLRDFNRVGLYNTHSPSQKLAVVPFCLTRTAADWFDNVCNSIITWDEFEKAFKKRFVNEQMRTQLAKTKLRELIYKRANRTPAISKPSSNCATSSSQT